MDEDRLSRGGSCEGRRIIEADRLGGYNLRIVVWMLEGDLGWGIAADES